LPMLPTPEPTPLLPDLQFSVAAITPPQSPRCDQRSPTPEHREMQSYSGYLFDLDGTLVDTAPDLHQALNHALTAHHYQAVDIQHTRHWIGHGARAMVTHALQAELGDDPGQATIDHVCDSFLPYYYDHVADRSQIYPEVLETLDILQRRDARLAVVTNKASRFATQLLEALDLTRHFLTIVCGDTTSRAKPAADPALHACAELGVAIDQVLFVGDSTTDVDCARAAGCAVVCVRDGYNHGIAPEALGADAVIESFRDLV
jgi:phosphoglycolate phosphatase